MTRKLAAGAALMLLAAACGQTAAPSASAGASRWVTTDKTITRTHEATSLLVDRNNSSSLYLSDVELQSGQCRFYSSSDGGATWTKGTPPTLSPYTNCNLGPAQPQNVRTELKQAPDGTLYYLYQAEDPAAGGARSVLLGRGNRAGQYYPQLGLAPDGRLDAAWYDFRNDPYPAPKPEGKSSFLTLSSNLTRQQDLYYTFSTDGGATWSRNSRVNDLRIDRTRGTWNGQYFFVVPPSLASTAGGAVVAWSDTRNGDSQSATQDIFTGTVTIGTAAADSGTPAWAVAALVMVAGFAGGAGIALLAAAALLRRRQVRGQPEAQ